MVKAERSYVQGVATGNIVTIDFGKAKLGLVQTMQITEDFGVQPASGIGDIEPAEHVPGTSRIQLQMDSILIFKNAVDSALNVTTELPATLNDKESIDSADIAPSEPRRILEGRTFTITVMTMGGVTIRQYLDCVYASGNFSIQKHSMISRSATFMARTYNDGTTPPKQQDQAA